MYAAITRIRIPAPPSAPRVQLLASQSQRDDRNEPPASCTRGAVETARTGAAWNGCVATTASGYRNEARWRYGALPESKTERVCCESSRVMTRPGLCVALVDDEPSDGCRRRRRHRDEQRWGRTKNRAEIVALTLAGLVGTVTVTAASSTRGGPFPGRVWWSRVAGMTWWHQNGAGRDDRN